MVADRRLPTFVVAGAPRCGTTSLHYYLRQHPQVCMTDIKEPNHFLFDEAGHPWIEEQPIIRKSVRRLEEYRALFRPAAGEVALGDVSPLYLYTEPTPARLRAVCGEDLKVIAILRRPAARAWSHFLHAFADVPAEERHARFAELVDAEMAGGRAYAPYRTPTHLVRLGLYADQVRRYHEVFGPSNVLVLLTEDLDASAADALRRVTEFLGVDADVELSLGQRYNTTGGGTPTGWAAVRKVLRKVQPRLKAALPPRLAGRLAEVRAARLDAGAGASAPADPAVVERIAGWCDDDVASLSTVLGRDLTHWSANPGA